MMDISKSWNCISREDFEVQLNMLKTVISRYLEKVTNILYPLSIYEEAFISFSI